MKEELTVVGRIDEVVSKEANDFIDVMKSGVPEEMKTLVESGTIYMWDPVDTKNTCEMVFIGISNFLRFNKTSKDSGPIGLRIEDDKGNFLMGAILKYKPNTDNVNMPGNWNLSYTTKEDDFKEVTFVRYYNDPAFCKTINDTCTKLFNWGLFSVDFISVMVQDLIIAILTVLDKNAVEGSRIDIGLEDIFIASVEVIDGVKEYAFTPGTTCKRLIKDDGDIQK